LTNSFESLDYIYVPAPAIDAAVRFYTGVLRGELRWKIHDGGVWATRAALGPTFRSSSQSALF